MAITDYLWPFERKFSQIPCAREGAIFGMIGGPIFAGTALIFDKKPQLLFKRSILSGIALFWLSFLTCRYKNAQVKSATKMFQDSIDQGKFD